MLMIIIAVVSFIASFIFALGGLGSAVALIPILVFLGIPFGIARSVGLFTNFISTFSATYHNFKKEVLNLKASIPLAVASFVLSPIGVYLSTKTDERIVGIVFTVFLFFAGVMTYVPKKRGSKIKTHISLPVSTGIGAFAGFLSGFLGIGGGGIISPLLMVYGLDPKVVVYITPFIVTFSSLIGFLTNLSLGSVDWVVTLSASIPAIFGGYLGAYVSHHRLSSKHIKWILGLIFIGLGVRFLMKFV
jgi:uncharacterized membrane protein YfcA